MPIGAACLCVLVRNVGSPYPSYYRGVNSPQRATLEQPGQGLNMTAAISTVLYQKIEKFSDSHIDNCENKYGVHGGAKK